MTPRLRRRYGASYVEALWRDACGTLWRDACGRAVRRPMRKHSGVMPADALWRDACGSALARYLRTRYGETPAETI